MKGEQTDASQFVRSSVLVWTAIVGDSAEGMAELLPDTFTEDQLYLKQIRCEGYFGEVERQSDGLRGRFDWAKQLGVNVVHAVGRCGEQV